MKKSILSLMFAFIGFINLNAQEFKIAVNAGAPVSVTNQFAAALDVSYLVNITDKFEVGLTTGFAYWFKRSGFNSGGLQFSETPDVSVLPIALTTRFNIAKKINLGLDLGYAMAIQSPDYQNGFYFGPKIQYGVSKSMDVVLGYRVAELHSFDLDPTLGMLTLGMEFKL